MYLGARKQEGVYTIEDSEFRSKGVPKASLLFRHFLYTQGRSNQEGLCFGAHGFRSIGSRRRRYHLGHGTPWMAKEGPSYKTDQV